MHSCHRLVRALVASLLLFGLALSSVGAAENTPISGRRTLVLGDSITQDGRYVSFLEYYLHRLSRGPASDLISIGLGSETISGLSEPGHPFPRPCVFTRLADALGKVKPAVVLACYGMNDGIYLPPSPERLGAFTAGLDQLTQKVKEAGATLILITPPVFDPVPIAAKLAKPAEPAGGYQAPYARYDEVLAEFAQAGLKRRNQGMTVIDLHQAMSAELATRRTTQPTFTFSPDGIHPNDLGHLLIARTVARGLGLTPPEATLEAELARIQADPLFARVAERRALRSEAWLSFIGYNRGGAFKSGSVKAAEAVAVRLQSEIEALARRAP